MRIFSILSLAAVMGGCSIAPEAAPQRSPEQQAAFMRMIAGNVAGASLSCLPSWNASDMTVIDGSTLAFGRTQSHVNIVNLGIGCGALTQGYAMQTENRAGGLCTGDVVKVVNASSPNFVMGSCVVASIIPYDRP